MYMEAFNKPKKSTTRDITPRIGYITQSVLKKNFLQKSRNDHNTLLIHLEKTFKRPLNTQEKKIVLYFAYQSDHHFRDYLLKHSDMVETKVDFKSNINDFYKSLSIEEKVFFDTIKHYFAEKASDFFIEKGWLKPSTDTVADLFSGVDYSFSKYLNNKYHSNICAIDTDFKESDLQDSKPKNIHLLNHNLLSSEISDAKLADIKERNFVYLSAPILPRRLGANMQRVFCNKQYQTLINNLKKLSKNEAHIIICTHINNAQENNHLFNQFCHNLSQESEFKCEIIKPSENGTSLIAEQFETIIHLQRNKSCDSKFNFCMSCQS